MSAPTPSAPPYIVPIGSTMAFGASSPYAATVVDAFVIVDTTPYADMTNNLGQGWMEEVPVAGRQLKISGAKIAFKPADESTFPALASGQQWTVAISAILATAFTGTPTYTGKWNIKSCTVPIGDLKNGWVYTLDLESTGVITIGSNAGM